LAAPINFTGNVDQDFSASDTNVRITPVSNDPLYIGQSQSMSNAGLISGWAIKDIRTNYDASTDTLYVGISTFSNANGTKAILGDADGNGDPGTASAATIAAGGLDNPNFGGRESFAIAFAPASATNAAEMGVPALIAGVPADKSVAGSGTAGFTVSNYRNVELGLGYNFGSQLANNSGTMAFNPSAEHPNVEFTITNLSQSGIDPTKGFWMTAYAGSPDDVVAGEASLGWTKVPASSQQEIPEPATLAGWSLVGGLALWAHRRRRRQTARV
jgi:hypothetical protein